MYLRPSYHNATLRFGEDIFVGGGVTVEHNVKAVIDIGSNSIKLRVGRQTDSGNIEELLDNSEIVQIGKGFVNGGIAEDRMRKALNVVTDMVATARKKGAETPYLVGTMALRIASNTDEFIHKIQEATGCGIRVLTGEEEAQYSWGGAVYGISPQPSEGQDVVMFDTGGASTEFVFGKGFEANQAKSLTIGAVTLTEKFLGAGPVPHDSLEAALNYGENLLRENGIKRATQAVPFVIGLGGGPVAMASVKRGLDTSDFSNLHGTTLSQDDLKGQIQLYTPLTLEERQKIIGLSPLRANVILGSVCIVLCALRALDVYSCTVSLNGLRHAVLKELFLKK